MAIEQTQASFNSLLITAIDETVADLLGVAIVESLHEHLLKFYGVRVDQIPDQLPVVHSAFEKAFAVGSKTLEKYAAKRLYEHLRLQFVEDQRCGLLAYVEKAKVMVESMNQSRTV
jgi:hypothetical protein